MKSYVQTNIIVGLVIGVLLIAGGWYVYNQKSTSVIDERENTATSTDNGGVDLGGIEVDSDAGGAEDISHIPVPSLDRPIVFKPTVPESIRKETEARIKELSASLKEDPNSIAPWIELGLLRKSIDDFPGAREAWEYGAAIRPMDFLAFGNLGNLYAYYLNDPAKAEKNFLQAIKNDPSQEYLYFQTHEFYRDVLKDDIRAKNIVKEGIRANPDSEDLKALLASIS